MHKYIKGHCIGCFSRSKKMTVSDFYMSPVRLLKRSKGPKVKTSKDVLSALSFESNFLKINSLVSALTQILKKLTCQKKESILD